MDEMDQQLTGTQTDARPHKLDLYSIPVFLLEFIILLSLTYAAFSIHFQYHYEPLVTGFYCDDTTYRQQLIGSDFTVQFTQKRNELTVTALLFTLPIVLVIFCELVNSMFGSIKFRQIRALCSCCKLHSITRRSIRFAGAFILGFLIIMISCDILATTTGRLRPYFHDSCPKAFSLCNESATNQQPPPGLPGPTEVDPDAPLNTLRPASQPISSASARVTTDSLPSPSAQLSTRHPDTIKISQFPFGKRQWVDLSGQNLAQICDFASDQEEEVHKFNQIAMSWPSYPAAIFTYVCLFISCYLCFVGTARPFRMISCVLVMALLLMATIFDVELVKNHFNHWEDAAAGAFLALVVVLFILLVYLNRFKDSHYYENRKSQSRRLIAQDSFKGYSGDGTVSQYNFDKPGENLINGSTNIHQEEPDANSATNNDLAMRYFQIPRANYRGAPRPLSALNQMRG